MMGMGRELCFQDLSGHVRRLLEVLVTLDDPKNPKQHHPTSKLDDDAKVARLKLRNFCWAAYVYVEQPDPWMSSSCFMTKPGTSRIKAVSGCSWRTSRVGGLAPNCPNRSMREHRKPME